MANVIVTKDRYTVEMLYQWDLNQVLEIRGLTLPSVPEVHFTNNAMDGAIVKQSSMDKTGIITVDVPNSLLQKPYDIIAYICLYDGSSFQSLYKIVIPVKARNKPNDYIITGDDDEVYSFNELRNTIENLKSTINDYNQLGDELKNYCDEINAELVRNYDDLNKELNSNYESFNTELTTQLNNFSNEITNKHNNLSKNLTDSYNQLNNNVTTQLTEFSTELDQLEAYVTPQQFGAIGDNETDDTAAFQAAVNSGFDVVIPPGYYRCSNIVINESCRIIGVGDVKLIVPDTVNIPLYESYTENTLVFKIMASRVRVENIKFDGNYTYLTGLTGYDILASFSSYGIRIAPTYSDIVISNCKFNNFKDAGIQITEDCQSVTIENNIFFDEGWPGSFNRGVQVIQSTAGHVAYHTIKNNKIFNCGEHGIVIYYNNDHSNILDNYIVLCGLGTTNPDGSDSYTSGACIKSSGCSNLLISGNYCEKGNQGGIIAPDNGSDDPIHDLRIVNNHCIGDDSDSFKGDGIAVGRYSENIHVCGNLIEKVYVKAYQYSSAITVGDNAIISDNTIYDCNIGIRTRNGLVANNKITADSPITIMDGASIITGNKIQAIANKEAIALYAPINTVVSGNTILNAGYGVLARTSADHVQIYGNVFNGVTKEVDWRSITPTNSKVDFVPVGS